MGSELRTNSSAGSKSVRRVKAVIGNKDHEAIMGKDRGEPVSREAVLFHGFGETVSGVKGRVAF
ncbi:hypothetical protein NC652_021740 [Populus alba x Populus x berolinensis]|nr:hypothetical protein NC652_021740 [Populus alba x Populus x berolinensis]